MKQYKKNLKKYLIGTILFSLVALIQCPLSSWAATAEIDIIHSQDRYPAGGSYPLLFHIQISNPWYIHGTEKSDNSLPTLLSFSESPGIKLKDFSFPLPVMKNFEYSKEPVEVFSGDLMVRALLVVSKTAPIGRRMIKGSLSCQACSSRSCLPPENIPLSLSLLISPQGENVTPLNRTKFELKEAPSDFHALIPGFGAGLWLSLAGVFIGGLFLNLTPCVYPLIPITVSYFGGRGRKTGGATIIHGILYVSGLAFTNSLLGLAAALSGDMLGSILQNPVVLMFVAGVLVALALSFFGFWEFRIPSAMTRLASKNFGGYFGTFFMGMTLGIVAAPCLGPFILGLLTYVGQKGDLFLGFLYFFVLSLGLGLPLSILAVFSGGLNKLPMSGEWMIWIKKVLGWVLVGMAGYLLQPMIANNMGRSMMFAAIIIAAGLHLGWLDRSGGTIIFRCVKKGLSIVLIIGAVGFFIFNTLQERAGIIWIPYDPAIMESFRGEKPIMLDFYADWCGPCKALDKKVFSDPEVIRLSQRLVTIRVDLTKRHPWQEELQRRYKIRGVPSIVFINGQGVEEKALRTESFLGRNEIINKMKKLINKR